MKKLISVIVGVIIIVVVVVAIVIAKNHKSNAPTKMTNSSENMPANMPGMNMNSQSSNSANTRSPSQNQVTIQNYGFSPSQITVKMGTTVTWANHDSVTHTVTEDDGQPGPNSGNLASGKSYSFTFDKAGTYKYHCTIHPDMTGTVTVTQ